MKKSTYWAIASMVCIVFSVLFTVLKSFIECFIFVAIAAICLAAADILQELEKRKY